MPSRYVFLGGVFPESLERFYLSNTKIAFQFAANNFQHSLISGLEFNLGAALDVLSLPFLGDYPKGYSRCYVGKFDFDEVRGGGFINLKVVNFFTKFIACRRLLRDAFGRGESGVLFVYGAFPYFLAAVNCLKRSNPDVKVCLIVPDLPGMMGGEGRLSVRLFNIINSWVLNRYFPCVDYYVLLTEFMASRLPIKNRRWCVVEGISKRLDFIPSPGRDFFIIFYPGTLAKRYGILDLLAAFSTVVSDRFKLWICGSGDGEAEVSLASKIDPRITFFGQLDSSRVIDLYSQVDLLVNPRPSSGDYTKYSFPSKVLEFYSTGIPCLMHRLPGIPEEYYDYCFVPDSESPADLAKALLAAEKLGRNKLLELGEKAKMFALQNKNAVSQTLKILRLIDSDALHEEIVDY